MATLPLGATRSSSPASGTSDSPSTCTGIDGGASLICSPASSISAAHRAPCRAGDDGIADAQRAPVDQHGRDRPAADIEVGLEHDAPRRPSGFAMSGGSSRSATRRICSSRSSMPRFCSAETSTVIVSPPHASGCRPCSASCCSTRCRVGVVAVDLVDRDHDRHFGRARVVDGLDGLRHDAVVGGDDEHGDVGGLRAAGAHGGERLVAGRVDERDEASVLLGLVGADVLRDAAGLARNDVGLADAVEQQRLAVVDVAHDGDDRRPDAQRVLVLLLVVVEQREELELLLLAGVDEQDLGADLGREQLDHVVGQRHAWR